MCKKLKAFLVSALAGLLLTSLLAQQPLDVQLPSGSILYFDLAACPSGWTEYTAGRGAYLTGLVSGGTKATLVGTVLTNQEDRTHTHPQFHTHPQDHTHGYSLTSAAPAGLVASFPSGPDYDFPTDAHTHTLAGTSGAASVANTDGASASSTGTQSAMIAPYLQFLMCLKT